MTELIEAVTSWQNLLLVLLVFGFAPGFVLRLLVKIYPRDDPRRRELVAELYVLGRIERLFFVAEQLETVLSEGVPARSMALARWAGPRLRRLGVWFMSNYWMLASLGGAIVWLGDFLFGSKKFDLFMFGMGPSTFIMGTTWTIWAEISRARSEKQ